MPTKRSPSSGAGTYQDWRVRERLAQAQGVDIKRIKFPTPKRLTVPQESLRSPFGPVHIPTSRLLGDCVIGDQPWPAANLAIFTPFDLQTDIVTIINVIMTFVVLPGAANMDVGIYDTNGIKLVSSGAETVITGHHTFTLAHTQLQEGSYYFAASSDSVLPQVYLDFGYPNFVMAGAKQMAAACPLPDTATLVDLATGGGMAVAALEFEV